MRNGTKIKTLPIDWKRLRPPYGSGFKVLNVSTNPDTIKSLRALGVMSRGGNAGRVISLGVYLVLALAGHTRSRHEAVNALAGIMDAKTLTAVRNNIMMLAEEVEAKAVTLTA